MRCVWTFRQDPINEHSPHNYQNRYNLTSLIQCHFRFYPKIQNNRRFDQSRSIYWWTIGLRPDRAIGVRRTVVR